MSSHVVCSPADPPTSERWLAEQFPHRWWLIADLRQRLDRATAPIKVYASHPRRFGHALERTLALDLCDTPPYAHLLAHLPQAGQQRLLTTAGYEPIVDVAGLRWLKTATHAPGPRLFTVGSLLTDLDAALHALRRATPDEVRVAVRTALHDQRSITVTATAVRAARPAFAAFWDSYTSGFQNALRSYGPVTAHVQLLNGLRIADFLAGTTIVELKTGHLNDTAELQALIDQTLTYALLAPACGHPVTAVVMYLARYHVLARYPLDTFLTRLAGRPLDAAESGRHLAILVETEEAPRQAELR